MDWVDLGEAVTLASTPSLLPLLTLPTSVRPLEAPVPEELVEGEVQVEQEVGSELAEVADNLEEEATVE